MGLELNPSPPKCSNNLWKLLLLLICINWPSLVTYWVVVQKIYSKMHPVLCNNTHHDATDLVNHGIVKNAKTWISSKWSIIFLRNKKIFNLCLRWHILRSYCFLAEVTFKSLEELPVASMYSSSNYFFNITVHDSLSTDNL